MDGTIRYRNTPRYQVLGISTGTSTCASGAVGWGPILPRSISVKEMWDVADPKWRDKLHRWIRYRQPLPVRPMETLERYFTSFPTVNAGATCNNGELLFSKGPCRVQYFSMVENIGSLRGLVPDPRYASVFEDTFTPGFSESEKNSLLQKALANARTSAWDVGTFLAELHKTTRMIRNVGRSVSDRTDRILSKRSVKTLEDFSSAWLEYRYGWRILYFDIMEMNESLLRLQQLALLSNRYTVFDSKTYSGKGLLGGLTGAAPYNQVDGGGVSASNGRVRWQYSSTNTAELRAGVMVQVKPDKTGFIDPLVTISEIIPYHLVVNWFINSKELIEAWSPFAHGNLAYGFVTETIIKERHVTPVETGNTTTHFGANTQPGTRYCGATGGTSVIISRKRVPRQPVMNLRLRLNFDRNNLLDAIAILLLSRTKLFRKLRGR